MRYKKKSDKFNRIIEQGGVLIHSITGIPYTPNDLVSVKQNNIVINKKGFNKVFKKYSMDMQYDVKDYGYCIMRANYGLDKNNQLSNNYLDVLKSTMSSVGVVKLLQRLIANKMIVRTGRGKYTLNPNIAQYGETIDDSVYKLFEG